MAVYTIGGYTSHNIRTGDRQREQAISGRSFFVVAPPGPHKEELPRDGSTLHCRRSAKQPTEVERVVSDTVRILLVDDDRTFSTLALTISSPNPWIQTY